MTRSAPGTVYLVGAGPGDPRLITLRGLECLGRADVVLYDYLVNPRLLQHARPEAEVICLGKHGRTRIWPQEEINARMIQAAHQGKCVVRLKGGDPAIFARGAEEAEALARQQIPYEIVPGVTVALAAASCAGIPITHREFSSAVALITAHEESERPASRLDFHALAQFPGSLVFYMGVTTAPLWTAALIQAGKPAPTPAAVVRRCSFPDQVTRRCTLAEVAELLAEMRPPVIVIVGEAAGEGRTLRWFEQRPLFGRRILVTRPAGQSESLVAQFEEWGADVREQPAIEIGEPETWQPVDAALGRLASYDWLVFSSANGVRRFLGRLLSQGYDLRAVAGSRLAAIGTGTADALAEYYLRADLIPQSFRAESLAGALAEHAKGRRLLLVRASRGREVLGDELRRNGALVEQVVAYSSQDVAQADESVTRLMEQGAFDWVTVTSSAIARSLVRLFGSALRSARLASISPVTSQTLRELGYEPAVEAELYTTQGLARAVLTAESPTP